MTDELLLIPQTSHIIPLDKLSINSEMAKPKDWHVSLLLVGNKSIIWTSLVLPKEWDTAGSFLCCGRYGAFLVWHPGHVCPESKYCLIITRIPPSVVAMLRRIYFLSTPEDFRVCLIVILVCTLFCCCDLHFRTTVSVLWKKNWRSEARCKYCRSMAVCGR